MSYCRFSKDYSDLYIIHHCGPPEGGFLVCYCKANFKTGSRSQMIAHIEEHKSAGDIVPNHVTDRLLEEIRNEGDEV